MTTGKAIAFTRWTFVDKVMSLLFNMPSVCHSFSSKEGLLNAWLQSPSAVILEPKKIKTVTVSIVSQSICHEVMDWIPRSLFSWLLSFKPAFSLFSFTSSRNSLVPFHLVPIGWCHLHIWGYWYFSQQSWFQLVLYPVQHFTWCTLLIS